MMIKLFFIFFIFGLSGTNFAAPAIAINYTSKNDLVLSAPNCELLQTQHRAICLWKKVNQPEFVIPNITHESCIKKTNGEYSTVVSECLPAFVKEFQHKTLYRSGANCWGTAMNFKGISKRPRFIWSNEMIYWMNSPICRKLNPDEKKQPGDFMNMYGPEHVFSKDDPRNRSYQFWEALFPGRITSPPTDYGYSGYHHFLHTETYLTQDITFGKDSPEKVFNFEFHNMNEVYGRNKDPDCQENQSLSPYFREYQHPPKSIRGTKCAYFSLAYRCENFNDYFARQDLDNTDKDLISEIEFLKGEQDKLFPLLTVLDISFTEEETAQMLKFSDDSAHEALEELRHSSFEKNHEMLLVLKYFTASGIRKSFEFARLTPPTEEL